MVIKCDVCGFDSPDQANFCGKCGVDLKEPREEISEISPDQTPLNQTKNRTLPPKNKKSDDVLRVINYCWLRTSEFPIVVTFILLLAKGKSELGFCECNICNQGYREIVAASKNAPGKRRLSANSREVVKEARGADITKFKLNVHDVLVRLEERDDNTGRVEPRDYDEKESRRKITVDVDETVLEKIVLKVLSTDKGRKVLKDALTR